MAHVPVYFDDTIKLIDVMRAAEAIGCTLAGDRRTGALRVVRKPLPQTEVDLIDLDEHAGEFLMPSYLKRQAE